MKSSSFVSRCVYRSNQIHMPMHIQFIFEFEMKDYNYNEHNCGAIKLFDFGVVRCIDFGHNLVTITFRVIIQTKHKLNCSITICWRMSRFGVVCCTFRILCRAPECMANESIDHCFQLCHCLAYYRHSIDEHSFRKCANKCVDRAIYVIFSDSYRNSPFFV